MWLFISVADLLAQFVSTFDGSWQAKHFAFALVMYIIFLS